MLYNPNFEISLLTVKVVMQYKTLLDMYGYYRSNLYKNILLTHFSGNYLSFTVPVNILNAVYCLR